MRIYYRVSLCIASLFLAIVAMADAGTYILSPKTGTVGTGEEIQLQLRKVIPDDPQSKQIGATDQKNFQWTLNSVGAGVETKSGTLTPGLVPGVYLYKAPNVVPSRNPVAISVSFIDDDGQKIILVSNIRVTVCHNSFQEDE